MHRVGDAATAAAELPPGPDLPPSRQSARWIARPVPFLRDLRDRYGDVFTLRLLHQDPWVVVGDPELVKQVFTAPPDVLHSGEANRHLEPIVGSASMVLLDEGAHMRQRRMLLPPFHGDRMARYGEIMRAAAEAELDRWPRGEVVASAPRMQSLTLEVILRAVFGVTEADRLDRLRGAVGEMVEHTSTSARIALLGRSDRLGESRFAQFRAVTERARSLVLDEVAHHRGHADLDRRDDVLSLLLQARYEDGSGMSDEDLRDELMTLLVAGHETSAMSLSWALELLVHSPGAMERTVAEADAGGGPYTEAVVRETLRVRPVFAVVPRLAKRPFELAGHEIPPGAMVMSSPPLVHYHPAVYPQPDEFRPERFLDRAPGTYSWIPFGGGVRRCVGASFAQFEMRVVLATILSRVRARAADPRPEKLKRRLITLGPSQGGQVILERR